MKIMISELRDIIREEVEKSDVAAARSNVKAALAALKRDEVDAAEKFLRRALDELS